MGEETKSMQKAKNPYNFYERKERVKQKFPMTIQNTGLRSLARLVPAACVCMSGLAGCPSGSGWSAAHCLQKCGTVASNVWNGKRALRLSHCGHILLCIQKQKQRNAAIRNIASKIIYIIG
jgi:hypothetical protein